MGTSCHFASIYLASKWSLWKHSPARTRLLILTAKVAGSHNPTIFSILTEAEVAFKWEHIANIGSWQCEWITPRAIRCLLFIKGTCKRNRLSLLQPCTGVQPHTLLVTQVNMSGGSEQFERLCHLRSWCEVLSIYCNEPTTTELMHFAAWFPSNWDCSLVSFTSCKTLHWFGCMLVHVGYCCDTLHDILTRSRELCFSYQPGYNWGGFLCVHNGCICPQGHVICSCQTGT